MTSIDTRVLAEVLQHAPDGVAIADKGFVDQALNSPHTPIPIEEVEPVDAITRRFDSAAALRRQLEQPTMSTNRRVP